MAFKCRRLIQTTKKHCGCIFCPSSFCERLCVSEDLKAGEKGWGQGNEGLEYPMKSLEFIHPGHEVLWTGFE